MDDVLLGRLRGVVAGVVGAARLPAELRADTALADGGLWLDSVELLQVVLGAEAEFGIIFEPGEDLVGDGLRTLGSLANLIQRRSASRFADGSAPGPPSSTPR
jgi:acyl carrier protein